ncbi:MAG: FtsQ-type POTRA domain-containing protein, partial [Christensenellaceae bacterium]
MKQKKKQHGVGKTILIVVLVILLLAGAGYFTYVFFQVETIKVDGNERYDSSYIEGLANVEPKTHMFFVDTDKIAENIYSVGVADYDVRVFHGYSTPYGATYNSYLIFDDKITLIDFVKK